MRRSVDHSAPAPDSGSCACLFGSPGFLVALALLIANDHWLKTAYPGPVTGKLSDFAGLFVVALALVAWRADRAAIGCVILGSLFVVWKSPLATPLIDAWNATIRWPVARTIDATDLIALAAIPAAMRYARSRPRSIDRRLVRYLAAAVMLLAVTATSYTDMAPIGTVYDLAIPRREVPIVVASVRDIGPTWNTVADTFGVELTSRMGMTAVVALTALSDDSTRATLLRVETRNEEALADEGRSAFEREVLPTLQRHEQRRLRVPSPPPTRVPQAVLPAGFRLRDSSAYRTQFTVGALALLERRGVVVDSVDLATGVHVVGRDSLLYLPVHADSFFPSDADVGRLVLLHGDDRVDLEGRLPYLRSRLSSPVVHERSLMYWGLRPIAAEIGLHMLYAMRYDFASAGLDSLPLGQLSLETDDRWHLAPPASYGTGIVYAADSLRWVVRPDFRSMVLVPEM